MDRTPLATLEDARQVRADLYKRLMAEADADRREHLYVAWSTAAAMCRALVALDPDQHRLTHVWTEADYDRYVEFVGIGPVPA